MKTRHLSIIACAVLGLSFFPPFLTPALAQFELRFTNTDFLIWSDAGPNHAYLVEHAPELAPAPANTTWTPTIANDHVPGVALGAVVPPWAAADRGFYRVQAIPRGTITATAAVSSTSRFEMQLVFALAGVSITPDFGVDVIRMQYDTLDARNQPTLASGIIAVPQGAAGARPLASIQRPTILREDEAPTASTTQQLQAAALASLGYVVALPDLLGFGDSSGIHPYVHTKASATAVVDMLRATRSWAATNGQALNDQLFLAGYSQGGHATMAAHRMLEEQHADEFTVTASAPMAGPYDLSETMFDLLEQPFDTPYYFPYLLFGYDEVYGFMTNDSDILQAPYDTTLRPLFNGQNGGGTINAAMPASTLPADILQPAYRAALTADPNHPLRELLRRNDLFDWTPMAPVRLIHCRGDTTVPNANSTKAFATFIANGAQNISTFTPDAAPASPLGHGDCALPALLDAVNWFDGFLAP